MSIALRKKCKAAKFSWKRVAVQETNIPCWPWVGALNRWGYGQCQYDGKNMNASRAAYIEAYGQPGPGMVVCHRCDNAACCNPSHLFIGTQAENLADCRRKGRARGTFPEGGAHPRHVAKLTPEMVADARRLYASGVSQSEIARRWGMHASTISRAVRGEYWGNVK